MRACIALVLIICLPPSVKSTFLAQRRHLTYPNARVLRVSAHISREDTQDGVSVGGFKKAAMFPVQLYIGHAVTGPPPDVLFCFTASCAPYMNV